MESPILKYTDYPTSIIQEVRTLMDVSQDLIQEMECESHYVEDRLGEALFKNWKDNSKLTPSQFKEALIKAELDWMLVSMSEKGYLDEIDGHIFLTPKGEAHMDQYEKNEKTNP